MENTKKHANNIRKNIVKMVHNAKSGHIGGALSAADLMTVLYLEETNITRDNIKSLDRDKVVFSKGHASALLYAELSEANLMDDDLMTYRLINSNLQGHPNMNYVDGVDMSTGSLGQGFSASVGMALANKLSKNDNRVYVLLGDGETEEGQVWEAAMSAAHYKLDNMCVILDYNGLQIDGDIHKVMNPTPLDEKFEAFGFNVIKIDGHNYDEIRTAYKQAREFKGKPTLILAKTIKGKGVSFMENNAGWHGIAPSDDQLAQALTELDRGDE